jgi:hypothetical protein
MSKNITKIDLSDLSDTNSEDLPKGVSDIVDSE